MDNISGESCTLFAKNMSVIRCEEAADTFVFPKGRTFLDVFNVKHVEDLELAERWKNNCIVKPVEGTYGKEVKVSMASPIGIGQGGDILEIDLWDKVHGPHGLVAGTIGSGKSDWLLTYVLSMAVNYHPDEVAFIVIDYKGGGMSYAFDDPARGIHLPHLSGVITNLDGDSIDRSLISICTSIEKADVEQELLAAFLTAI